MVTLLSLYIQIPSLFDQALQYMQYQHLDLTYDQPTINPKLLLSIAGECDADSGVDESTQALEQGEGLELRARPMTSRY